MGEDRDAFDFSLSRFEVVVPEADYFVHWWSWRGIFLRCSSGVALCSNGREGYSEFGFVLRGDVVRGRM